MPHVNCNGTCLYYEFLPGPGPVLMLSNSLGTDLGMWRDQVAVWSQDFSLLRYDARGHGRSAVPAGPYTIASMGEDAVALLNELSIQTVNFCGLSLGGMVGQWLGVHHPERLDRLVLSNTGAHIGTAEGWNARIDAVRDGGMRAVVPSVLERWFSPGFRSLPTEMMKSVERVLLATNPEGYIAACAAVRDMDQRAELHEIRAQTLVVSGSADMVTTLADSQVLLKGIEDAQSFVVDAAHLANIEAAHAFSQGVLNFLLGGAAHG